MTKKAVGRYLSKCTDCKYYGYLSRNTGDHYLIYRSRFHFCVYNIYYRPPPTQMFCFIHTNDPIRIVNNLSDRNIFHILFMRFRLPIWCRFLIRKYFTIMIHFADGVESYWWSFLIRFPFQQGSWILGKCLAFQYSNRGSWKFM